MNTPLQEFQNLVLARNRARAHFGKPAHFSRQQAGANPLCGDFLDMFVSIDAHDDVIRAAHYQGEMSAITAAAAEIACAQIQNQSRASAIAWLQAAQQLVRSAPSEALAQSSAIDLAEFQSFAIVRLYPARVKTALLPLATLFACLQDQHSEATVSTE
jgi:nitrogen fixation protein NifU and related proteins